MFDAISQNIIVRPFEIFLASTVDLCEKNVNITDVYIMTFEIKPYSGILWIILKMIFTKRRRLKNESFEFKFYFRQFHIR